LIGPSSLGEKQRTTKRNLTNKALIDSNTQNNNEKAGPKKIKFRQKKEKKINPGRTRIMPPVGIEPTTSGLLGQLAHENKALDYETDALPTVLQQLLRKSNKICPI
jgi:hypothetical protein